MSLFALGEVVDCAQVVRPEHICIKLSRVVHHGARGYLAQKSGRVLRNLISNEAAMVVALLGFHGEAFLSASRIILVLAIPSQAALEHNAWVDCDRSLIRVGKSTVADSDV